MSRVFRSVSSLGSSPSSRLCASYPSMEALSRSHASMSAAAPIAVRGRRNGEKRANPDQASSQRKIRSGLMARHSSMTRRTLYMWPSNVQFVRSSILTRSSRPSPAQRKQRALDRLERYGAVHRVFGEREGLDVDGLYAREHHAVVV